MREDTDGKYKIGIIFCGGCNCYFDREELYREITDTFGDRCDFFVYREDADEKPDLIVLINGCQSECLMSVDYSARMLLINNRNCDKVCELIEKELCKIEYSVN